jgi:hypothetical protein
MYSVVSLKISKRQNGIQTPPESNNQELPVVSPKKTPENALRENQMVSMNRHKPDNLPVYSPFLKRTFN